MCAHASQIRCMQVGLRRRTSACVDTVCVCDLDVQRRSGQDGHLHWHRCHDGGPGGRGQSGHLRLRGAAAQAEVPHGPSGGTRLPVGDTLCPEASVLLCTFSSDHDYDSDN